MVRGPPKRLPNWSPPKPACREVLLTVEKRRRLGVEPITEEIVAEQQALADLFYDIGMIPERLDISSATLLPERTTVSTDRRLRPAIPVAGGRCGHRPSTGSTPIRRERMTPKFSGLFRRTAMAAIWAPVRRAVPRPMPICGRSRRPPTISAIGRTAADRRQLRRRLDRRQHHDPPDEAIEVPRRHPARV